MNLEHSLAELRTPLLRFAKMQLRDDALSEDVVSETLLAMLERPDAYQGQSSLRTFATGILKHKVIDTLRKRGREVQIEPLDEQSLDDAIDSLFNESGHWREPPQAWGDPERALEQREFMHTLQNCIEKMPPRLSRVFTMRESLEMEVDEVCSELGITSNNCFVMLYRARMQLRECLEHNWFQGQR